MYSVHSSAFGKCGVTMRPVIINEEDDALFNANFSPLVAITYQNHVKEIRRMVKQQGNGFWIRFITSLRSHAEQHRLMDGIAFARAEAVFVDMLQLLTCGDNLQELTRLVNSLRAMQSAIIANDYQILLDPVLRIMMTHYDKPLDGLRLYFRFVAGLVVIFRRWKQAAWRTKKEGEVMPPWEAPPHWKELSSRDYSEWTFEGNLLCMFGPELPNLLGLSPGLPCWMPDELKNGIIMYPTIPMGEENLDQITQDMNRVRNKRKGRRRKNRQFEEGYPGYEPYATKAAASSGDSGVCLIEQGMDTVTATSGESQKSFGLGVCYSESLSDIQAVTVNKGEERESKNSQVNDSTDEPFNVEQKESINAQNKDIGDKSSVSVYGETPLMTRSSLVPGHVPCSTNPNENIIAHSLEQCKVDNEEMMKEVLDAHHHAQEHFATNVENCNYCGVPEPYLGEERPDYLYILECRGPGGMQFSHQGGMPPMEQNFGPNYEPCLHIYRRDCANRVLMCPNNFRAMPHMEEMPPIPRPPWSEGQGNFIHSHPMGFFEAPMADYMGPDTRRRGPQNRRFRQRRMRPNTIGNNEETLDSMARNEAPNNPEYRVPTHETQLTFPYTEKKQWRNKKSTCVFNIKDGDTANKEMSYSKSSFPNDSQIGLESLETDTNKSSAGTIANNPCTSGYALAVCGLLGRSEKTDTNKEQRKQEDKPKSENLTPKSIIINSQKNKKPKRKPGRQQDNISIEKVGKISSNKELSRDADKGKRFDGKQAENNITQKCYLKSNTAGRGRYGNYKSPINEIGKLEKSNINEETSFISRGGKGSKKSGDYRTNDRPCEGERPNDRRRKWKSVWTRRRDPESLHLEEKATAEGDGFKKKEITDRDSNGRSGIPQNVPDILKQVENCELKGFWKECNEASKPQRKFRSLRKETKRNNVPQEIPHENVTQLSKDSVTPVVKLDVLPAVEPKDKEITKLEKFPVESIQKIPCANNSISEIGWYEETLAEDKDREKQRQANKLNIMSDQKKNKNRKWKKKNKRSKDERAGLESFLNEGTKDDLILKNAVHSNTANLTMGKKANREGNGNRKKREGGFQEDDMTVNRYRSRHINSGTGLSKNHARKIINEESQTREHKNNTGQSQNIECCKTILHEVLLSIPDNPQINSSEGALQSPANDNSVLKHTDFSTESHGKKNSTTLKGYRNISDNVSSSGNLNEIETVKKKEQKIDLPAESVEKKYKDYEIAIVNRRRQVYLARTLKYLAGLRNHIPLFTKKDLIKFFLFNEEILKFHHGSLQKLESDLQIVPSSFRTSSNVLGVPNAPPNYNKKKLLFRCCDNCNVLEKYLGEYGECMRCKEMCIHSPRVYCSRFCQLADWKRRHRAEHKCQDIEDSIKNSHEGSLDD